MIHGTHNVKLSQNGRKKTCMSSLYENATEQSLLSPRKIMQIIAKFNPDHVSAQKTKQHARLTHVIRI